MTVNEYNKDFLPKINAAKLALTFIEQGLEKVKGISQDAYEQCRSELKYLGWDEEVKRIALEALDYYKIHEGVKKIK